MATMFEPREHRIHDVESGLTAFVVIDDTTLGPAAGGIRTRSYASEADALADASALARAMTYKCALAGLPAGGGKGVVNWLPGANRERVFERLGTFVESLGGEFLTAGDMGTTHADLLTMARHTQHVHTDEADLAVAVGAGCVNCMRAALRLPDVSAGMTGVRIAVQGCGTVGAAVARAASAAGADLLVADIDEEAATVLASELGAEVVAANEILTADVDLVAPCATGGVIDAAMASDLHAGVVCGGANNILAAADAEDVLRDRGVVWVPDVLSSAGAVILGVGQSVLKLDDCSALLDRMFDTTNEVVGMAQDGNRRAADVAEAVAEARIVAAREAR